MKVLPFFAQRGLGSSFRRKRNKILLADPVFAELPERSGITLFRYAQKLGAKMGNLLKAHPIAGEKSQLDRETEALIRLALGETGKECLAQTFALFKTVVSEFHHKRIHSHAADMRKTGAGGICYKRPFEYSAFRL